MKIRNLLGSTNCNEQRWGKLWEKQGHQELSFGLVKLRPVRHPIGHDRRDVL